ncbi:serine/threonine-protein kinase [Streptacidiphilus rugosus]|uniref:serine/threonine-protein kinase n=1 Tax=Streptacidiphilus rugosus TaxID=405783 RepID=UPI00068AA36A|nr:serine/threonine-protein kinase [Streptacidiphilus rugosus]
MQALEGGDPEQLGGYRLLARLGAGGMGRVYLARSRGGRRVALKVIRPELADDPDFRARFAREVAAARVVGGAFTVAVLDADTEADTPWLATEFVAAPTLAQAVRERGPLPVESVVALAAGLAEGLAAIHAAGVVHRDLKPSNVLLALDGPRVIDFGISRAMEATELTRTGVVVGSPGFMSPEQIEGGRVTPATDVFSLGAVLAYAAVGHGPFGDGATPALLYRVVHAEPQLETVPAAVRGLIASCLAKEPSLRPTPDALLDLLEASGQGAEPTQTWLPVELTSMIERVEAEFPSRLGSLSGPTAAASPPPTPPPTPAIPPTPAPGPTPGAAPTATTPLFTPAAASERPTPPLPGFGPAPASFAVNAPAQASGGARGRNRAGRRTAVLVTAVLLLGLLATGVWALTRDHAGGNGAAGLSTPTLGATGAAATTSPYASGSDSGSGAAGASASDTSTVNAAVTVTVPGVVGETVSRAEHDLTAAGFSRDAIRTTLTCEGNARGVTGVLSQSPTAGSAVASTRTVRLTAEAADCKAYASEVGRPVAYAVTDLANQGFTNVSNQPGNVCGVATDPVGTVEAQDPQPVAEGALRAGTAITLFTQPQDCVSPSPTATSAMSPSAAARSGSSPSPAAASPSAATASAYVPSPATTTASSRPSSRPSSPPPSPTAT